MSDDELKRLLPQSWDRKLRFTGRFPSVRFGFRGEGGEPWKVLSASFFDGRTHKSISSGYGTRGGPSFSIECDLELWHRAPVEIILTLAQGPVELFEIEPKAGELIRYGPGELKLAAVLPRRSQSWGSSSDGRTNNLTVGLNENDKRTASTFVFVSLPQASSIPIDFDILDLDGKVLPGSGGGSGGYFLIRGADTALTNIHRIRAKYYPKVRRLVFRLPGIPGLPPENDNVKNLFDVKVPFARIRDEYEFERFIRDLTQMDLNRTLAPVIPPGYFPKYLTNATPREILTEYLKLLPTRQQVRVDTNSLSIKLDDFYIRRWWRRMERFAKDRF